MYCRFRTSARWRGGLMKKLYKRTNSRKRDGNGISDIRSISSHLTTRQNLSYPLKKKKIDSSEINKRISETAENAKN